MGVTAGEAEDLEREVVLVRVTSVALVGLRWTWGTIVLAHLRYREAVADGRVEGNAFRMPGAPVANWLVIACLALIAVFLGIDHDTRAALHVAPIWFAPLAMGYRLANPGRAALAA